MVSLATISVVSGSNVALQNRSNRQVYSSRYSRSPMSLNRHDGKEARSMARKTARGLTGGASQQDGDSAPCPTTVKVTLHLSVSTAQRLGVESAMRRVSQSAIAEEVLSAYLSRWQLPEVPDAEKKAG
jgi:hypothetical protein